MTNRLPRGRLICDQCEAHALRWFRAEDRLAAVASALEVALPHLVEGSAEYDEAIAALRYASGGDPDAEG